MWLEQMWFKFRGALDLFGHSKFKKFPENLWIIEGLEKLDLSKTTIVTTQVKALATSALYLKRTSHN